jgi:hypothetical protein
MPARKRTIKRAVNRDIAEPPASRGGGLQEALNNLKNLFVDLTSIDVSTFQGEVTVEVSADGKFNPSDFFAKLQAQIKDSKLALVAHTHVAFDLDSVVILKPDADAKLIEAHNKAVQTAVDARQAVLRMIAEVLKLP